MSVKNINNLPELNAITGEEKVILSADGQAKSVPAKLIGQQADWAETDSESPAYVKNKPGIPEQLQADWSQTDTEAKDFIKNKPTGLATQEYVNNAVSNIPVSTPVQPDWNQTDETAPDYVKNRPGGYTDYTTLYSGTINVESGGYAQIDVELSSHDSYIEYEENKREYIITFDGEEQRYTEKGEWAGGGVFVTFVGNPALFNAGSDSGEPFFWYGNSIYTETPGEHTITIKTKAPVPIDPKFLYQSDLSQTDSSKPDYVYGQDKFAQKYELYADGESFTGGLYSDLELNNPITYNDFDFWGKANVSLITINRGFNSSVPQYCIRPTTIRWGEDENSNDAFFIEFIYKGEIKTFTISRT